MNDLKLYALAILDLGWITAFVISELDPMLRSTGLVIGLIIGIFTLWKLKLDIELKMQERKSKEIDLKIKEKDLEDRIRKDYE